MCYTKRVGVRYIQRQKSNLYAEGMILTHDMPEDEIDEAIGHLSEGIRIAKDEVRKKALLDLVDALLDAKLDKQGEQS